MRLENLLALTRAKLINEPCVNNFDNIIFEPQKVKRGDLFFAFDNSHIEEAVNNGAYGIVFDKPTQISDREIAWIKVEEISDALIRLLRFRMIEKEVIAYECNEIILKLSMQVITLTNFLAVYGDLKQIFNSLWNIEEKCTVLFSSSTCNKNIFASTKELPEIIDNSIDIMEQTLFETSFIYENSFYERQLISPFFMPYLERLLYFFKSSKISFSLKKFTPIEHFEAVFTNNNFEIKNFGTSDKVLIFEPNASLIDSEILFLQNQASWANTIFIVPSHLNLTDDTSVYYYDDEKDILNILKDTLFNFALVAGVDKSILAQPLNTQAQLTLEF
ncbi:hypothetical protein N9A28_01110 [Sulfurimonas sp.]|nr:hypothetical protein [Sulfurimonas sp.]